MKKYYIYKHKFCNLFIAEENEAVCNIFFYGKKIPEDYKEQETSLIKKTADQLNEYFNGERKVFDLKLSLRGTDFQVKIWNELLKIPYGKTLSYGQLAAMTGNPKACRAAGMANNRNPIPVIIPCHRVIGAGGSLTGYAGGLELKRKLLELESLTVLSRKNNKRYK